MMHKSSAYTANITHNGLGYVATESCIITLLTGLFERYTWINTKSKALLLIHKAVVHAPIHATIWHNFNIEAAIIRQAIGFVLRL